MTESPCASAVAAFEGDGQPVLLQGSVRLPDLRPAHDPQQAADAGGRGASFREKPARRVRVTVYRSGADGKPPAVDDEAGQTGQAGLARTKTDAEGNWCVAVAESVQKTPALLAVARLVGSTDDTAEDGDGGEPTVLRRSIVTEYGNAVTVRSEALTRVLLDKDRLTELSPAAYLNLLSVAATAVDLLSPVPWRGDESVEQAVQKVREALKGDERFGQKLAAVVQ